MKVFIDFEATQFKQTIISIGCVTETGKKFYTLVHPSGSDKISNYITTLTGITKEMLINEGYPADEAFEMLYNFLEEACDDGLVPQFYCYGNNDADFINNTLKYMSNFRAINCAMAIKGNLIDYSNEVRKFFKTENPFSLKKMYTFLSEEEKIQKHDALEDAEMLSFVVENFKQKCSIEDKEKITAIPRDEKPVPKGTQKRAPEKFINWPNNKMDANTCEVGQPWILKAILMNNAEKYFDSMETAVMWVIRYLASGVSIKKDEDRAKVKNKILKAIETNKNTYNCNWYWNIIEDKEEKECIADI